MRADWRKKIQASASEERKEFNAKETDLLVSFITTKHLCSRQVSLAAALSPVASAFSI
jgi:hypothetical protein